MKPCTTLTAIEIIVQRLRLQTEEAERIAYTQLPTERGNRFRFPRAFGALSSATEAAIVEILGALGKNEEADAFQEKCVSLRETIVSGAA